MPSVDIDHVLTRNAVAASIMTIDVTGSNHRSLLANIAVPIDPVSTGLPSPAKGTKVPNKSIRLANSDALVYSQ